MTTMLILALACANTAEGVAEDVHNVSKEAKAIGAQTKEVAREVTTVAAQQAVNATEKVVEGAAVAVQRVDATAQAVDVKTSLMADTTIDSTRIRVEADNQSRTIYLRGQVSTQDQKTAAERVATIKAAGYIIKNELVVGR